MPSPTELLLDDNTIQEIVLAVHEKFVMHTNNISFHFDEYGISIMVFRDKLPFVLPNGPVDVRLHNKGPMIELTRRGL